MTEWKAARVMPAHQYYGMLNTTNDTPRDWWLTQEVLNSFTAHGLQPHTKKPHMWKLHELDDFPRLSPYFTHLFHFILHSGKIWHGTYQWNLEDIPLASICPPAFIFADFGTTTEISLMFEDVLEKYQGNLCAVSMVWWQHNVLHTIITVVARHENSWESGAARPFQNVSSHRRPYFIVRQKFLSTHNTQKSVTDPANNT